MRLQFLWGWILPIAVLATVFLAVLAGTSHELANKAYIALFFASLVAMAVAAIQAFFSKEMGRPVAVLPVVTMLGLAVFGRLRLQGWTLEDSVRISLFAAGFLVVLLFLRFLTTIKSSSA